jgi:malate dehydrogenase (oxaloacetate-decarboxylating)
VVFACANPVPEIWPWEAKQAGAKIVATGRSDFANQVNNSLGFPAIFRGVIDVAATAITDEMCIAAAQELARCAEDGALSEERILPTMDDPEVYPREAAAVALKAIEQGVAKRSATKTQLIESAAKTIRRAQLQTKTLMEHGMIAPME